MNAHLTSMPRAVNFSRIIPFAILYIITKLEDVYLKVEVGVKIASN